MSEVPEQVISSHGNAEEAGDACTGARQHFRDPRGWYGSAKRILDITLAAASLAVFALPMIIIALAIRLRMGTPVIFKQLRPGLNEQPFKCFKFRTMTSKRDRFGKLLPDEDRTTGLGAILRRTSLDELPQLWNILRGDLSIVGPRPLCAEYLPYYTELERRRHRVRPGLTGWAQIHGRNSLSFDDRLRLDVWYVDHFSFLLDVAILLKTFVIVITQSGFGTDAIALDVLRAGVSPNTNAPQQDLNYVPADNVQLSQRENM